MKHEQPLADERTMYGGQAVVEGVMMRSPRYFAIACRRLSNNEIVVKIENVESKMAGFQWLNKPFLRGTLALIDAMMMGIRALTYAANVQAANSALDGKPADLTPPVTPDPPIVGASPAPMTTVGTEAAVEQAEGQSINGITIGLTLVVALLLGYGLFWVVPTLITGAYQHFTHTGAISAPPHAYKFAYDKTQFEINLVEGIIRIAFFLIYIAFISRLNHVQRVFQYHGAEHKAINTLETGAPLTVENVRQASRIHPRCGTNFIVIVLIVSILVFALFNGLIVLPAPLKALLHLALLPIVAGVSYEVLKFAGKHRHQAWAQWMIAPGLATQYLTTRVPDDSQLEVAIASLEAVWNKEHAVEEPAGEQPEPAASVA